MLRSRMFIVQAPDAERPDAVIAASAAAARSRNAVFAMTSTSFRRARLRKICGSKSQVNPTPPCNCTQSVVMKTNASVTSALASDAQSSASGSSAAVRWTACATISSVTASFVARSAARCFNAWNPAIGWPNCSRVFM